VKELMLLRHGKSNRKAGASDFERPLKDHGKREAQRIGAWLRSQKLLPEVHWEERHRGTQWYPAEQAKAKVSQAKLLPLIDALIKRLDHSTASGSDSP